MVARIPLTSSCTQIIDISFVSVRPTRSDSNETSQLNRETYFEGQSNPLVFTNASTTYTVFTNTGPTLIPNVYFIDNTDSLFNINIITINNLVGGISLKLS